MGNANVPALSVEQVGADERRAVEETIARIRRRGRPLTDNRVVGGLSFGFWPRLVGTDYDDLWRTTLHRAFPCGFGRRSDVAGQLNRIAQLRNNVAHDEAILRLPLEERRRDVVALALAVDPAAARWIERISQVPWILSQAPLSTPRD